jgi:hypothetical protein
MTIKTFDARKAKFMPASAFNFSFENFEELTERANLPEGLKLPLFNLSSLFLAPVVMGAKALYHLGHSAYHAIALPISCFATVITLGANVEVRNFTRDSFFGIIEHVGEAILSVVSCVISELTYLAGIFLHPEMPATFHRD